MESDSDVDPEVRRIDRMNEELEDLFQSKKEYQMEVDRKVAKREKKAKALIEKQRKQLIDVSEEEAMMNDDIREKVVKFKNLNNNDDLGSEEEE